MRTGANRPLLLASTSKYRHALLSRLQVPFICVDPALDEAPLQDSAGSAREMVHALAREKARAAAGLFGRGLMIGADQCAEIEGERLGKPGDAAAACRQLERLSGAEHRLWTAVAILDIETGRIEAGVNVTTLRMRRLTAAQIARYVAVDAPVDCAGSYKVERLGVALFDEVRCTDPTAIEGLPLTLVVQLLQAHDYDVLDRR